MGFSIFSGFFNTFKILLIFFRIVSMILFPIFVQSFSIIFNNFRGKELKRKDSMGGKVKGERF